MHGRARLLTLATVGIFLGVLGSTRSGEAAGGATKPPTQAPAPAAQPKIDLPARVISMKRVVRSRGPIEAPYTDGELTFEIEVAAPTSKDLATNLVIHRPLGSDVTIPVSAVAGTRVTVPFTEERSSDNCFPEDYSIGFQNQPPSTARTAVVTPHCTFTTEDVDPFAGLPPDTKASQRAGRLYYVGPSWGPKPFTCGTGLEMSATAKNAGSAPATQVRLRLEMPGGAEKPSDPPVTIAPSATSELVVAKQTKIRALAGDYKLTITGNGVSTYQPAWSMRLKPKCTFDVDMK